MNYGGPPDSSTTTVWINHLIDRTNAQKWMLFHKHLRDDFAA
jgi:hypothetical protein